MSKNNSQQKDKRTYHNRQQYLFDLLRFSQSFSEKEKIQIFQKFAPLDKELDEVIEILKNEFNTLANEFIKGEEAKIQATLGYLDDLCNPEELMKKTFGYSTTYGEK